VCSPCSPHALERRARYGGPGFAQGAAALEKLCRTYGIPSTATFAGAVMSRRRAGLTQGFLLQLLERHSLARVDAAKADSLVLLAGLNYFSPTRRSRRRQNAAEASRHCRSWTREMRTTLSPGAGG